MESAPSAHSIRYMLCDSQYNISHTTYLIPLPRWLSHMLLQNCERTHTHICLRHTAHTSHTMCIFREENTCIYLYIYISWHIHPNVKYIYIYIYMCSEWDPCFGMTIFFVSSTMWCACTALPFACIWRLRSCSVWLLKFILLGRLSDKTSFARTTKM